MEEWKKSMWDAYSRMSEKDVINEVLKIKAILDDDKSDITTHSWGRFNKLLPLEFMCLSPFILCTTGIGSSVFRFRDHPFKRVKDLVSTILKQWRMTQIDSRKTNIIPNGPSAKILEGEANLKKKPSLNMINKKKLDIKSCNSIEEKVETTKRKLYESYKEAEDAKKKRRIQVLEFHELGKQGLLPKVGGQMKKPRNTLIKKLRSNSHCRQTLCY